jgi:hypothetical protein
MAACRRIGPKQKIAQELTQHYRAVLGSIFGTDLPPDVKRDIAETTISLSPAGRGPLEPQGALCGGAALGADDVVALILLLACATSRTCCSRARPPAARDRAAAGARHQP